MLIVSYIDLMVSWHTSSLSEVLVLFHWVAKMGLGKGNKKERQGLHALGNLWWQRFRDVRSFRPWASHLWSKGHLTNEPRAVTMKAWEPKRKSPKAVPTHLQNHVVWSRILKCSVKLYVIGPSTKCYFIEILFMQLLTYDYNRINQ